MRKRVSSLQLLILVSLRYFCFASVRSLRTNNTRSFSIGYEHNTFLKDGEPFRYISGSIHYFRIPPELWVDRLRKVREGGYNAIQFVVEWISHEPFEGHYDFRGRFDLVRFIKIAQKMGLLVILRPGPYICAERNGGGLPYWLYRIDPDIQVRTSDATYLKYVDQWFDKLLPMLQPLLYQNGGPIIMTQIENEYGSFGMQTGICDIEYMVHLRDKVRQHFGDNHVLYTTDGASPGMIKCGSVPGAYATVDFGSGINVTQAFHTQRLLSPQGPLVNSEYYPGWLDYWGVDHHTVSVEKSVRTLKEILDAGANVNIYVVHGGTSFGFEAGANIEDGVFRPEVTSYDYNSPISEAGDLTPMYFAFQKLFSEYIQIPNNKHRTVERTPIEPKGKYGTVEMHYVGNVFDSKGTLAVFSGNSTRPKTFEELDQNSGFVLYETTVQTRVTDPAELSIKGLRDRATVFVNEHFSGILSRNNEHPAGSTSIPLPFLNEGDTIQLLVENQGRIGYGPSIGEFKGLTGNVTLGGVELLNWAIFRMPLNTPKTFDSFFRSTKRRSAWNQFSAVDAPPPKTSGAGTFWVGTLTIPNCTEGSIMDTFLQLDQGWGKGVAMVNAYNVGRYWPVTGPQETLYVPSPYLTSCTDNKIILFEQERIPSNKVKLVEFVDEPTIDGPTPEVASQNMEKLGAGTSLVL